MGSPIDGGVVVVTGASSGIGAEIARQLAPRARRLVLVARRRDRLEALASELRGARPELEVAVRPCDLSSPADADALSAELAREPVDVLVNNAGAGDLSVFDRSEPARQVALVELNVTSLVRLTRAVLAGMVERGRGGVLNVSSGFGMVTAPGFALYVGTKHFVTGFTESLRADLAGTGVRATQVCPGPVATEFEQNVGNFTGQKVPGLVEISAARCARAAIRGFDRNRALVIPGVLVSLGLLLHALSPRFLWRWITVLLGPTVRRTQLASKR